MTPIQSCACTTFVGARYGSVQILKRDDHMPCEEARTIKVLHCMKVNKLARLDERCLEGRSIHCGGEAR